MRRSPFLKFVRAEGFCCPWNCLKTYERWKTESLAQEANLDIRTIQLHRARLKNGLIRCADRFNCQEKSKSG